MEYFHTHVVPALAILAVLAVVVLALRLAKLRAAFEKYTAEVATWAGTMADSQKASIAKVKELEELFTLVHNRLIKGENITERLVEHNKDTLQRVGDLENHNIRKATAAPKKGTARAKVAQVKEESTTGSSGDGGPVLSGDSGS